jgi:hypothetical protein
LPIGLPIGLSRDVSIRLSREVSSVLPIGLTGQRIGAMVSL